MSIDVTALPSELLVAPQPLIGFYGLDVTQNVTHKTIWDAFNNRQTDRPPAQYKLLLSNYEFPVVKPKRTSYEWYHPKGILKRNWMLKHLHVLPAVIVLFQDIEWNDPNWNEKQLQCASTVQTIKNALQERYTRICLVLLQKLAPLPPGEDVMAAERAATLTTACGINSKMLFILPYSEHLIGYINRLEATFLDMALSYYGLMSKRIRSHRDQLTTSHITLKIRYQFKLGFIAELRQDFSTALKHYTQSYSTLDEVRINDNNCLEIKTIAGFLNYKICRLMFKLKIPKDAINHFLSHIEKYRNRMGCKDILFEHFAWLSTQHTVFAELFCEAIKNGLPALQTQHPGIYFHRAAEYSQKRKESFLQCNLKVTGKSTTTSNDNMASLLTEFFGIRAYKSGDTLAAQQSINAIILDNEKSYNHSAVIIHLLGQAMAQFKIYKSLRYRKKLAIDMADEYFKNGDLSKALTLYSLMLPDFRQDKWPSLFSDVLLKTMRCSLLSASINDYICCSLEALSLDIDYKQAERVLVLENLWKVLQNEPPISQTALNENQNITELRRSWENALVKIKTPIIVDLDKISPIINIYSTFEQIELKSEDNIQLNVILNLHTDVPIKIRQLLVIVTDNTNNFKLQAIEYTAYSNIIKLREVMQSVNATTITATVTDDDDVKPNMLPEHTLQKFQTNLILEPMIYYKFTFTMNGQQFLENTQLKVARYELFLGTMERLSIRMLKSSQLMCKQFHHYNRSRDLYDNIIIKPICYITPTFHLDTHSNLGTESILVNEFYPVITTISNPFDIFLQAITLNMNVPNHLRNHLFLATDVTPSSSTTSKQKLHSSIQIDIGDLSMHGTSTVTFYIYSIIAAPIILQQRISYITDVIRPKAQPSLAITDDDSTNSANSSDDSPEKTIYPYKPLDQITTASTTTTVTVAAAATAAPATTTPTPLTTALNTPIQLEFMDKNSVRKTQDLELKAQCEVEFKFYCQLYTLSRKPLTKIYCGEDFLLRAIVQVQPDFDLEILETYFICDHNLIQSTYSFKRKKHTNIYRCDDKLEDVIMLRTNSSIDEWITLKDYERNENEFSAILYKRLLNSCKHLQAKTDIDSTIMAANVQSIAGEQFTKCLAGKIPNNMTIVNNNNPVAMMHKEFSKNIHSTMANTIENKLAPVATILSSTNVTQTLPSKISSNNNNNNTRVIYNKATDAVHTTGHLRGFLKATIQIVDQSTTQSLGQNQPTTASAINLPHESNIILGIFCIKWRRANHRNSSEENESKFVITGLPIEQPPLNIYCTIEERVYVKKPMVFRIILKNPTAVILHLVATLIIQNADPFICSGHKQLDITILPYGEKELVYNLYPYKVGWHSLPQLILEYNAQIDPTKDETQNIFLADLIQRWMPKKVFILPSLKQHKE